MCACPSLFNTCIDCVLGRVVGQSHYGTSVGITKITDLVFTADVVIFVVIGSGSGSRGDEAFGICS